MLLNIATFFFEPFRAKIFQTLSFNCDTMLFLSLYVFIGYFLIYIEYVLSGDMDVGTGGGGGVGVVGGGEAPTHLLYTPSAFDSHLYGRGDLDDIRWRRRRIRRSYNRLRVSDDHLKHSMTFYTIL